MTNHPIVIGAGPAGLAVAGTLKAHGVPCIVLERASSVGAAWQGRYDSLRLHTVRWLSGLPGAPIPRRYGRWVSRDDLVAYLHDYAARFEIKPELGVDVTRIDRAGDDWRVDSSAGTREAPAVIVATGYSRTPHLPDWPGRAEFPGTLLHSSDYRNPSPYAGQHVLVVGAGNSAAEIALDLVGVAARVELAVRTPPNIVRRDTLGVPSQLMGIALKRMPERGMNVLSTALRKISVPDLSPYGMPVPAGDGFTQFLRSRTVPILDHGFVQAVRERQITVVPAVEGFAGADVCLAGGKSTTPDTVIAATGYRPALEPMVGHLDVLDDRGMPLVHGAQTMPQAPRLHFVGIKLELAGLLREIGLEARAVGRALAAQPVSNT